MPVVGVLPEPPGESIARLTFQWAPGLRSRHDVDPSGRANADAHEMTLVSVAAGLALVALVTVDIVATVLHPNARGPVCQLTNRGAWLTTRGIWRATGNSQPMAFAGGLGMAMTLSTWVAGLAVGYALIYLPFIGRFSYQPGVPFADPGVVEALYVSGAALTTVGFGDIVATSDALRLLTVVQAASGLLTITASVAYILSVYPLLTETRTAARTQADLATADINGAVRLVAAGATTEIAALQRSLVVVQEHLRRFPVLFYFRPRDEGDAFITLLRAGAVMYLVLALGLRPPASGYAAVYRDALRSALDRMIGDFERRYVRRLAATAAADDPDVGGQVALVRAAVAHSGLPTRDEPATADEAAFVVRLSRCLDGLACEQGYGWRALVADAPGAPDPQSTGFDGAAPKRSRPTAEAP